MKQIMSGFYNSDNQLLILSFINQDIEEFWIYSHILLKIQIQKLSTK